MKKIFFLSIAAASVLSANAQAPDTSMAPKMPKRKSFTHDSLLKRWVVDVNGLAGVLTQDLTTAATNANYPNIITGTYKNGGNLKFTNGMSYGGDVQLGFFWGRKRHFGVGAGFMYLAQSGDVAMSSPFHVEYQATDYQGNTFRQKVTSNNTIMESIKITNLNIPVMLKYKVRFSKRFGFTADAGVLFNVQQKNSFTAKNASFDYEAIYQPVLKSDGKTVDRFTYDNGVTPAAGDILYTKAEYVSSSVYPTVESYFNKLRGQGYNVGLGVTPNKNTGSVSYTTGSVGFMVQPSINYFFSDYFALNLGGYYMYQPATNKTTSSYQVTNKVGDYSSVLNTVSAANAQSYGVNLGVRVFFGKHKDSDKDGIPDIKDRCPRVPGQVQFFGCPDSDGDGIVDGEDSCVNAPGTLKFYGCPDSDGDGIMDKDDACPFAPGTAQFKGCPDRDGDGIVDKDDACPDKAGTVQFRGCADTDGDGIADPDDKCPNEAGPSSNNGCPVPPVVPEPIKVATPIQFELNKTTIQQASYPILKEIAKRMTTDKDATVIVEGYADITGAPSHNKSLSMKRAKAVKAELVQMGVNADRIKIAGHGSKNPVDDNKTAEGRARNRRAVMHLNMVSE